MTTTLAKFSPGVLSTNLRVRRSLNSALRSPTFKYDRTAKIASMESSESRVSTTPVPLELMEHIVELYVKSCFKHASDRTGPLYGKLSSLTLTSKQVRQITLRAYFRSIYLAGFLEDEPMQDGLLTLLCSVDSENKGLSLPGGFSWVKSCDVTSRFFSRSLFASIFPSLNGLDTLRIDLMYAGLKTQTLFLQRVFAHLDHVSPLQNLSSLSLTCVPWIGKRVLSMLAQASPNLVVLTISSTGCLQTDCCPTCYGESMSRVYCSPVPDVYPDIESFSSMIGTTLSPLTRLTHLNLGIFLSPSDLKAIHVEHTSVSRDWSFSGIHNCEACSLYESLTKIREHTATAIIAKHLEALEVVCWDSCFGVREISATTREDSAKAKFAIGRSGVINVTRLRS